MTEEEVRALIQELRDEIPAIVQRIHEELEEELTKEYKQHSKGKK